MTENRPDKAQPWLLTGTIIGGVLLLVGGAIAGSAQQVVFAVLVTLVIVGAVRASARKPSPAPTRRTRRGG